MGLDDWDEDDWLPLLLTIQQGNCILMLGPDASTEKVDGQLKPCTELLANEISSKIASDVEAWKIDTNNLAQVSQFYSMKPGRGRTDLLAKVTSFCHSRRHLTSDLHEKLAVLPFNLIISSTPDNMLYEAFKKEKKDPIVKCYNFKGAKQEMVPKATKATPLIYHLYGTTDDPSSLVLSEDDVLDFIVAVVSKNPPLPANILSEIRDPNKSFLFLGFGFGNWYLRVLLHVLGLGSKESRSFALEQFTHPDIDEFQRTMVFFRESNYKIQIYCKELHEFVTELQDRYKKFAGVTSAEKNETESMSPDAPQVFICHASEDKDFAAGLYNQLRQQGIRPWLDKENLRGGDQWDRQIEKTIEKVDFFIILQSRAMANKEIGYVNKEIFVAQERQRYYRPGIRYIIPVKIDDSEGLEDLSYLQFVDLTEEKNIADLVQVIRRDYERRKKR